MEGWGHGILFLRPGNGRGGSARASKGGKFYDGGTSH